MLKKTYYSIKRFVLKLLIYFLPRPQSAPEGSEVVTERGIRKIIGRLFVFFLIGMGLYSVLYILGHLSDFHLVSFKISTTSSLEAAKFKLSVLEGLVLVICMIYHVMMPFLRYMYKWLRITGIIYAVCVGYLIACSFSVQTPHQNLVDTLSILSTAVLTLLPLYLLKYKNKMLPKYLARFTHVSFAVVTLGGSVVNILNQIPFLAFYTGHVIEFSTFDGFRIAGCAIKAFLAFMFMFLAYDRMRDYARRGVSKDYEWLVAFTGFYTVCVIVLKISELLQWII